jgi:hypothetical protein
MLLPVLFSDIFASNPIEDKLYRNMKKLTLLSFSRKFTERGLRLFEPLARKVIENCDEICRTILCKQFNVYCKLHHVLHYGDLIRVFGPLYLYSTWHYERMHQPAKQLGRIMRCWINPEKTIHSKQQLRKALFEQCSNYLKQDFSQSISNFKMPAAIISETTSEFESLLKAVSRKIGTKFASILSKV